jgi:hypothetical protein
MDGWMDVKAVYGLFWAIKNRFSRVYLVKVAYHYIFNKTLKIDNLHYGVN